MRETYIAIAGGGIAGLRSALELSKAGFKTTVIEPNPQDGAENHKTTYSTPIIFDGVANDYGIQFDQDAKIERFETSFLTSRRRATTLLLNGYLHYLTRCLYAPSIRDINTHLYEQTINDPNISFTRGKVTDVIFDRSKVYGVKINGNEELEADLVIDATGSKSVISRKITEHDPSLVVEKRTPQPSTVLGAYVTTPPELIHKCLPKGKNVIYSEQLPNDLQFIFTPSAGRVKDGSSEKDKYLLLVEGNRKTIEQAYVKGSGETAERRFSVIKTLSQRSRWESILASSSNPRETILFNYTDAVLRKMRAQGVALVGDARMNTSPIVGLGLFFLNDDVKRLVKALESNPSNIEDAIKAYDRSQAIPTILKWSYSKKKYKDSYTAKSNSI